jgi:predicted ester cyclase
MLRLRTAEFLVAALVLFGSIGAALAEVNAQEATPSDCPAATPEENVAVVRRFYEEGVNHGDLSLFDEVIAPDAIYHAATVMDATGPEALKAIFADLFAGLPGTQYTLLTSTAGPDAVAVRYQASGVHSGEFRGFAPTGETITWTQSTFVHVACGQISEIWSEVSQLDRLQQFGGLEADSPAERMAGTGAATSPAATPTGEAESCAPASPDEVLAVVDRVRAEVYNEGTFEVMPEIFAEDYVHGSANGPDAIGIEAGVQRIGTFVTAFPDLEWTFDEVIVEGDRVSARWTTRGTHDGELAGIAPTGNSVEFTGISHFTVHCGKVVEFQTEMDAAGMLAQAEGK